jgi:hypothetical protein
MIFPVFFRSRNLTEPFSRESDVYHPNGTTFRIDTASLTAHINFMKTMNAKLNPGSDWWMEVGHNGNGNIEVYPFQLFIAAQGN